MSEDKIAFEKEVYINKTKELKINAKKSMFSKNVDEHNDALKNKEKFEERANKLMSDYEERQKKAALLAKDFMTSIRSKTLQTNKGAMEKAFEDNVRKEWQELIMSYNNDPNEEYDGMGSLAAITLVFKTLFEMRDRINELEYSLQKANKPKKYAPPVDEWEKK